MIREPKRISMWTYREPKPVLWYGTWKKIKRHNPKENKYTDIRPYRDFGDGLKFMPRFQTPIMALRLLLKLVRMESKEMHEPDKTQ